MKKFKPKNIMKKIPTALFLLFLLLRTVIVAVAQDNAYNIVKIPPSPNASALGKYGDVPVDKSNGLTNISIPIYEIQIGRIKVPISLSYHASGLKVEEKESWVGMGWTLSAGGVIARTMNGRPDEIERGFLDSAAHVPDAIDLKNRHTGLNSECNNLTNYLDDISSGQYDYEPDKFTYNFSSYSGSFFFKNNVLDKNHLCDTNIMLIPFDKIKIRPTVIYGPYGVGNVGFYLSFSAVDVDGIQYFFDASESNWIRGTTIPEYLSSWYLTRIYDPITNRNIYFNYNNTLHHTMPSNSFTQVVDFCGSTACPKPATYGTTTTEVKNEKVLTSITFDGGAVAFSYSPFYAEGMKLDEIIVTGTGIPMDMQKSYKLDYDTVLSGNNCSSNLCARLFLKSVLESEPNGNQGGEYKMFYNPLKLPARDSYSMDYWGYYNNRNNSTLLPYDNYDGFYLGDANREIDTNYVQAGMLTRLTYPTGGYSDFTYESNRYSEISTKKDISHNLSSYGNAESTTNEEICQTYTILFNPVKNYDDFSIDVSVVPYQQVLNSPSTFDYSFADASGILHGPNSGTARMVPTNCGKIRFYYNGNQENIYGPIYIPSSETVTLPNLYVPDRISINMEVCASAATVQAALHYIEYDPTLLGVPVNKYAAGLRIKKIDSFDPYANKHIYKYFDYGTNGYLISGSKPTYYVHYKTYEVWHSSMTLLYQMILHSNPTYGLGVSSNNAAYSKVVEYDGADPSSSIGKTESSYWKEQDGASSEYFYTQGLSNGWMRSHVLYEIKYRHNANNTWDKVQQTNYTYSFSHNSWITGLKATRISSIQPMEANAMSLCEWNEFDIRNYQVNTLNFQLDKVTSYEFNSNGNVNTITFYTYNPQHLKPVITKTIDSRGDTLVIVQAYPLDSAYYSDPNYSAINTLINNNMIYTLLREQTTIKNQETKYTRWDYELWNSKPYLYSIKTRSSAHDSLRTEVTVDQYDLFGNPLQTTLKGYGLKTAYIWAYTSRLPVVKAVGTDYTSLNTTIQSYLTRNNYSSLDEFFNSLTSAYDSRYLSFNQELRSSRSLKSAMINTYLYAPLIGIRAITDENSVTSTYDYDKLGRVIQIKDQDANVLKSFFYHYQNQTGANPQ